MRQKRGSSSTKNPPKGAKGSMSRHQASAKGAKSPTRGPQMRLDKDKGQHLLKNPGILDKIIAGASVKRTDTVLEIGPGTGNLTLRLLPKCAKVVALEIDPRMVDAVKKRALSQGYTHLEVRQGDALRADLGNFHVCTANLPYQISSPFVFKLLRHPNRWRVAVLMFQREFAERLVAQPREKHYCRLSINVQLYCTVSRVCKVDKNSFNPPPKVESMVVRLIPKEDNKHIDFAEWDGMMRICFCRKNRMLRALFLQDSTLKALLPVVAARRKLTDEEAEELDLRSVVEKVLLDQGLAERRSISISIEEFRSLFKEFHDKEIWFENINMLGEEDEGQDEEDETMFDIS